MKISSWPARLQNQICQLLGVFTHPVMLMHGHSLIISGGLNLLLRRFPGLKRTPDVEVHLRALQIVEDFRHGFQHLDERIKDCARDKLPLLATLAWAHFPNGPAAAGRVFLMVPGALRPGEFNFVNPVGKPLHGPIDLITLSAFGQNVGLSSTTRRVADLIAGIDRGFRLATANSPGGGADALVSVDVSVSPAPPTNGL